ncbi:MAG: BrnT family toxin [Terracidiphilus sp.]
MIEFDWDDANIGHIAEHDVRPREAEEVILNRPVDLGSELRNGEKRTAQIGETNSGRILVVISTLSDEKVRVVTAWPANKDYRRYFATLKRNGNVGRIEEQDLRE